MTTDTAPNSTSILDALKSLDPTDDSHWTVDGFPKVPVIQVLCEDSAITRNAVTEAWPELTRAKAPELLGSHAPMEQDAEEVAPFSKPSVNPGPPQVPGWLALEVVDEEIMAMDPRHVWNNHELVNRGIKEFNQQIHELVRRREQITKKLAELGTRCSQLSARHERIAPNENQQGIRAYIERQNESRAKRREQAMAFLKSHTNPGEVKKLLEHRAPIDVALNVRKPAFGTQRPAYGAVR